MDARSLKDRLPPDGRAARKDRNRRAVLDAVIELFSENNLVPDVHQVVERSGVSLRSVYRYFEDRTALLYAAMDRNRERSSDAVRISSIGQGPIDARIDELIEQRIRIHDQLGPTYRACATLGATSPLVEEELHRMLEFLTEQVETHFGPELDELDEPGRGDLLAALDGATTITKIDHLRRVCGHDDDRIRRVLRRTLGLLLGASFDHDTGELEFA